MFENHSQAQPRIARLLSPLRRSPLDWDQQLLLALQFVAWVTVASRLPDELKPDVARMKSEDIIDVFSKIRESDVLGGNGNAFDDRGVRDCRDDAALMELWQASTKLFENGFIDSEFLAELFAALRSVKGPNFVLSPEVVQLMTELSQVRPGDSLYLPFDSILQFALAGCRAGASVSVELMAKHPLPHLIKLISGQEMRIETGNNPLVDPKFVDGTELLKFSSSISVPPMGWRVDDDLLESDLYNRFRDKTGSGTVLSIRHILAQTTGRMVVLTNNNVLSGVGPDRALREDLVEYGLEAVISLPPGVLNGLMLATNIVVVDKSLRSKERSIMFIDGGAPRFGRRDARGKIALNGWRDILEIVLSGQSAQNAFCVPLAEVAKNDYHLMVSRYVKSDADEAAKKIFDRYQMAPLEKIVDFIRPALSKGLADDEDADDVFFEIGSGDIRDIGVIVPPKKRVTFNRTNGIRGMLSRGDLVLTVRGNVGRVGIILDSDVSEWVPSQSMIVMRTSSMQWDPLALMIYMRSALGQLGLSKISSGSSISMIQVKELRKMMIPMLPRAEQDALIGKFHEMKEIQDQIECLQEKQNSISSSILSLS